MNDSNIAAFGCVGSTIRLVSGTYLDLRQPDPAAITLFDVSLPLSHLCRFGGQTERFYSVAEHSVACAHQALREGLPRSVQLACLMHDAAEAFIGDVVKPLKLLIEPLYGPIEERIEAAIAARFGIDFETTADDWKRIDRTLLIAERRALFAADGVKWTGEDDVARIDYRPRCLESVRAASEFEVLFFRLKSTR